MRDAGSAFHRVAFRMQTVANGVIIAMGLLTAFTLARRWTTEYHDGLSRNAPVAYPAGPDPRPGTHLSQDLIKWDAPTLVLVLSTTCRFCSQAAPQYARLADRARRRNRRVLAIFPQRLVEARYYLAKSNIYADLVIQGLPSVVGASATPTMILVGKGGTVWACSVGAIPLKDEEQFVNSFNLR
jgi:hypothetical protein